MSRPSKLREKDTRMPDPAEARRREAFRRYLDEVRALTTEAPRSQRFALFLQELLGEVSPGFLEDYARGAEKVLRHRHTTRVLRGRADQLFGNVVLEFEADLQRREKRREAEEQLRRYVAILWSQEAPAERRPYLAVATDGVRFLTFSPTLEDPAQPPPIEPEHIRLALLEEADWSAWDAEAVYAWLDRTFLRQRVLSPTSEDIARDFGLHSHAFRQAHALLRSLWHTVGDRPAFQVVFQGWERYLRFVYGAQVGSQALFARHTYLATLAKLMAWLRLTGGHPADPTPAELRRLILGEWFRELGIHNFIEEDFFAWIARDPVWPQTQTLLRRLLGLLRHYNLRGLAEDVFKALYQELVDPETRHDLGEFYTPDWLARRIIRHTLEPDPQATVLDPACGSGTFLYSAIREKRRLLGDSQETLRHILQAVQGIDIHPLAVLVARTNYLLALGDLLERRRGAITLPVYLADAIRLPEWEQNPLLLGLDDHPEEAEGYRAELADGVRVSLPKDLLASPSLFDRAVDVIQGFARAYQGRSADFSGFRRFLRVQEPRLADLAEPVLRALFGIARTLKQFLEEGRDSIWAFILKNIYKPLFLQGHFDLVVGNPPWIAFRYMEPAYQRFLRRLITQEYRLVAGRGHLVTQMEIATLFWARAADLYLKAGGRIAFVLPKSVFSADQHDALRRYEYTLAGHPGQAIRVTAVWDLEDVQPLFNISACVVMGRREAKPAKLETWQRADIPAQVLRGQLPRRNAALEEAQAALEVQAETLALHRIGRRSFWAPGKPLVARAPSPYLERFMNGATLYPRTFWFVRLREAGGLGFNPARPPLETAPEAIAQAKKPYHDIRMRGTVEADFLYATLLSSDLVPFGQRTLRLVVLPIRPNDEGGYDLLTPAQAREAGYVGLARWLEEVETLWRARRGSKASAASALEWLDHQRKLTSQSSRPCYRVVYNASGTHLAAAVLPPETLAEADLPLPPRGLVVDHKLYVYETDNASEAYYLAAVLNSPRVNALIKPMQSRGQWGARDIHKKPLELPIPAYEGNGAQRALADLGRQAQAKVRAWLAAGHGAEVRSSGVLRRRVRDLLADELAEIDRLVQELIG